MIGDILEVEMMDFFLYLRNSIYIFFNLTKFGITNVYQNVHILTHIMRWFQTQNSEFMSGTSKLLGYEIIIPPISPSPKKGGAQNLHWLVPIFTKPGKNNKFSKFHLEKLMQRGCGVIYLLYCTNHSLGGCPKTT